MFLRLFHLLCRFQVAARIVVFWIEFDGACEHRNGVVELSELAKAGTEVVAVFGIGQDFNGLTEICRGGFDSPGLQFDAPEAGDCVTAICAARLVRRIKRQRFAEERQGVLVTAAFLLHAAPAVPGVGGVRLQCERVLIVLVGLVKIPAAEVSVADVAVDCGVIGIQLYGRVEFFQGAVVVAALDQGDTVVVVCFGVLRFLVDCPLAMFDGRRIVAAVGQDFGEIVVGQGIVRIGREGAVVVADSLIDVAVLAALDQGVAEIGQWPRLIRRLAGAILPQCIAVPPNHRSIDGCRHQQDDDNDCRGDQVPSTQGSAHEQDKRQDRHQARQV